MSYDIVIWREMLSEPAGIAQILEPIEGGVVDDGFVETFVYLRRHKRSRE